MYVNVAVLTETHPYERRVALVPAVVPKLGKLGARLHIPPDAGPAIHLDDAALGDVAFDAESKVTADIGTPASVFEQILPNTFENDPVLWADQLPTLQADGNKYTRGHALLWGGWPTAEAARMAARAAARIGAGLTTVAVPDAALPVYAAALTSVVVSVIIRPKDLEHLLADHWYTGLKIGPGAGVGPDTRARVLAMRGTGRATVLDASALSSFTDDPTTLLDAVNGACATTPHEGEFQRLFEGVMDMGADELTRARAAAHASSAIVVLKGSDTVIAAPDGSAIINTNAPPTLDTAGAGDVLAGVVLGLLTEGIAPFLAAAAAVWLHGAAASSFGPGLLAKDLPDLLPAVLQKLQERRKHSTRVSVSQTPASGIHLHNS